MKEYLNSFRIIAASQITRTVLQGGLGAAVGIALVFMMNIQLSTDINEDFREGFFAGFLPAIGIMLPVMAIVVLNGIFNALNPAAQGYKYYHSLPNGSVHFKRALITGNIISLLTCTLWSFALFPIYALINCADLAWVGVIMGFLGLGIANFVGFSKRIWVRFLGLFPICAITGFLMGFFSAFDEDGKFGNDAIPVVLLAVSAAVFAAGFIFAIYNSTRKWNFTEKEKSEKHEEAAV